MLDHIQHLMEEVGQVSGCFLLNRIASEAQVVEFESKLGLELPQSYREYVLKLADGGVCGDLELFPLAAQNVRTNPRFSGLSVELVVYPLRQNRCPDGEHYDLVRWDELTGDERMEGQVGLNFGGQMDVDYVLILNGAERGRVCAASMCFQPEPGYMPKTEEFYIWFERCLNRQLEYLRLRTG
jgi:hypothetical protein